MPTPSGYNYGMRPKTFSLPLRQACWLATTFATLLLAAEPPPIPPGFENNQQILAAIGSGKIPLVNANGPLPDGVELTSDIEFGTGGGRPLQLDLYTPAKREGKAPAIVFLHGGGWSGGKRRDLRFYAAEFAGRGLVAICPSYRLSREAPFPAAVEDVKCAVRWLRAHAEKFGVDPDRIAVSGNSAGGHLAMMVGYSPGQFEGSGGWAEFSSSVRAVVNFYGPYDLTTPFATQSDLVKRFLGGKSHAEHPQIYRDASPSFHLAKGAPPTLVFHGDIDDVVPIDQAESLVARLKELGVEHAYDRFPGWPHAMDLAAPVNARCVARMEEFFAKHLRPAAKP